LSREPREKPHLRARDRPSLRDPAYSPIRVAWGSDRRTLPAPGTEARERHTGSRPMDGLLEWQAEGIRCWRHSARRKRDILSRAQGGRTHVMLPGFRGSAGNCQGASRPTRRPLDFMNEERVGGSIGGMAGRCGEVIIESTRRVRTHRAAVIRSPSSLRESSHQQVGSCAPNAVHWNRRVRAPFPPAQRRRNAQQAAHHLGRPALALLHHRCGPGRPPKTHLAKWAPPRLGGVCAQCRGMWWEGGQAASRRCGSPSGSHRWERFVVRY
jgi:hypothetical protein